MTNNFYRFLVSIALTMAIAGGIYAFSTGSGSKPQPTAASAEKRVAITSEQIKKTTFSFGFVQMYADPVIENLNLPGSYGKNGADNICGKIIRSMRFQNVTAACENRWQAPPTLGLAMIMEESTGMDLLPNASDDGGQGLVHEQPSTASEYGLKTYDDCDKLICKKHGKALRQVIIDNNYDRRKLIAYDDRFHPVKNIDAAMRKIANGMQGDRIRGLSSLQTAVRRYSGPKNYKKYWEHVLSNMAYLNDPATMKRVEAYFNRLNPNLKINGKPAGFKEYVAISQQQNYNYGLGEYLRLPKYSIANYDPKSFAAYVRPLVGKQKKLECE